MRRHKELKELCVCMVINYHFWTDLDVVVRLDVADLEHRQFAPFESDTVSSIDFHPGGLTFIFVEIAVELPDGYGFGDA